MTLGERWRRFREWDRKGLLVKELNGNLGYTMSGYVIDRRIFRTFGALLFACLLYVALTSGVGWQEGYVTCPPSDFGGPCVNPFFQDCDAEWCREIADLPEIERGSFYGTPPDPAFERQIKGLWAIAISGFALALIVNHLLHNRGRPLSDILPPTQEDEA